MLSNPEEFKTIMSDLRKLPEKSDEITAYGSGSYLGVDVLGDFTEAIYEDENLKTFNDDIINTYYQLYSIDFQHYHEGVGTFYENFYKDNKKENVIRACEWFRQNNHEQLANIIQAGYENDENKALAAQWIDMNTEEIYVTFRELMFLFEKKYL